MHRCARARQRFLTSGYRRKPVSDEALLQKIRELPVEQQAAVEDFVEFLAARERRRNAGRRLRTAQSRLAADPLAPVSIDEINAEVEAYRAEQRRAAGT